MVAPLSKTPERMDRVEAARKILGTISDPEIPVLSISDMGILRSVSEEPDGTIEVVITPTYSGCPAMGMIATEISLALAQAGVERYRVVTRQSPPWTTDWISADARERLRAYGIAPPVEPTGDKSALFARVTVPCPRCGSEQSERIAEFGATACKALYRCTSCLEPFEHFKCVRP